MTQPRRQGDKLSVGNWLRLERKKKSRKKTQEMMQMTLLRAPVNLV